MLRTPMMSRCSISVYVGAIHTLAWWCGSSAAQDNCAAIGGAVYNSACYAFADHDVSCTDKCVADGALCNEDALDLSTSECESVLAMLGVDIASTTAQWSYNTAGSTVTSFTVFDENFMGITPLDDNYKTSGCIVSPTFDATDQTSFTTEDGTGPEISRLDIDAAEAHNFQQKTPTCAGASKIYRRVCSCVFPTSSPATPYPTPSPTPLNATLNPTPAPTPPASTLNPTIAPSTLASTPAPTTPSMTPHPTPAPTQTLIEAGYWRTSHASGDIRRCPNPGLCLGGVGGGDDLCIGDNTGAYCQVCPTSHFSSVNGVCLECGLSRSVTASHLVGLALAAILLLGAAIKFLGSSISQAPETGKNGGAQRSESFLQDHATQQVAIDKLREKLLDLGLLVIDLRQNLPDTVPQRLCPRVKYLLVTIEMFATKLIRILPRAPSPGLLLGTKEASLRVELLTPAIGQLASAVVGLSGAVSGEEATAVAQIT